MGTCASKSALCTGAPKSPEGQIVIDSTPYLPRHFLEDTNKALKIKISSERRPTDGTPTNYPCAGRTKGTALILNNSNAESKKGTTVDVKNVSQLLKAIKFKTKIVNNLKANEIVQSIDSFAKNCKAKDVDMCVIVIIGDVKCTADHNKLAEISGTDSKFLPIVDIIERLSDEQCPQLKGKPKVFLFHGHYYDESQVQTDYTMKLSLRDMFIANAVLTGKMQKQTMSSYYIQAMCKVFMDEVYEKDLESMIQNVEQVVYNHDRSTQHTHYDNLYFKKCYFQAT